MMDFALLGTGHETLPLIRALASSADHRLVAFWTDDAVNATRLEESGSGAVEVLRLAPAARRLANSTEVLNISGLNAVIIDASDSETLEVAKQLAANSIAILLVPNAAHGIEFIYQLGLIRDEQPDQFRLYPIRPGREHPLVDRLRQAMRQNRLGHVHQLLWERDVQIDGADDQPALLKKVQVDQALLADADVLKSIAGEYDQVTALQTGDPSLGIVQATVTLTARDVPPTQWVCRGTHGPAQWRLTVTGAAGNIVLSGGRDLEMMYWRGTISGTVEEEQVAFDYGPAVLKEFESGLTTADTSKWADDLNRIFDLLEGTHRSLRRRRTVELYFDTPSERSNFKTQMTAVGCGVLMLTLLTIVLGLGAGIVANELKLPPIVMQVVRVLVFAPLFIFLILQAAIFLSRPSAGMKA